MKKITGILTDLGGVVIIGLALLTAADVTGRYVFNSPIKGTLELSEVILSAIVALAVIVVTAERAHISVDIVYTRLSFTGKRVLALSAAIVGVVVFAVLIWQGILTVQDSLSVSERTDLLGVPKYPFRGLLVFGFSAALVTLIFQIVRLVQANPDLD